MKFYGEESYATQSLGAVSAGFFGRYSASSLLGIQAEMNYVKSGQIHVRRNFPTVRHLELSYLQIPVMARFKADLGRVQPSLLIGPYASVLMAQSYSQLYYSQEYSAYSVGEIRPATVDVGFVVGAGVDYVMGPAFILADLRYNQGLVNIDRGTVQRKPNRLKQLGVQMNIGAGFKF